MTILQFIQKPQRRGAEIFGCQLSEELQALGHKVIVVSIFEGKATLPFSGEIIHLDRPNSKRFLDITGWKKIARLVHEKKPDVIQCNAGDTLKYVIFSKKIFGWEVPVVVRNASTVSGYMRSGIVKSLNGWLYKQVNQVISVSHHSAKDLNALFSATQDKTVVIPIGVPKIEIQRQTLNNYDFVHVGGFSFEKNHNGLLRIWKKVVVSYPGLKLHLIGDGPLRQKIEDEVNADGLQESVIFHGWVSNPMDYMAHSKCLLLPSIIEGLPGVLLEAMYCKTPVIAYNVGGIPEIVQNGQTGFLIPKDDENAFAKAMEYVLLNDTEAMCENAFQQVSSGYRISVLAKDFEKAYREML